MVRLALDLGLRRGEIAGLALDDIDWRVGTIRLRRTKGGREDTLPLPEATGRAIADGCGSFVTTRSDWETTG
jgi:integrase